MRTYQYLVIQQSFQIQCERVSISCLSHPFPGLPFQVVVVVVVVAVVVVVVVVVIGVVVVVVVLVLVVTGDNQ